MGGAAFAAMAILGQAEAPRLDALHPWGPDEVLLHSLVHERIVERQGEGWRSDVVESLYEEDGAVVVGLVRGARWHDGVAVVADDVCATLDTLGAPGSASPFAPGVQAGIEACEVVDERTAKVTLRPDTDPVAALSVPLVPAHLRPSHAGDPRARVAVGCGPYRATPLPGNGWALEAVGRAPYARLQWVPGVPAGVATQLVVAGEALATASAAPRALDALRRAGVPLLPWDRPVAWVLVLDPASGPWLDRRVRRALDLSLDRDALARRIAGSDVDPPWVPTTGPTLVGGPGTNRAVVPTDQDLDGAAALLAEAGLHRGLQGRWADDEGRVLQLRLGVPAGRGFPPDGVAVAFVGSGIDVTIVPLERSAWMQGALGGGLQGHVDALLLPRDLVEHPDLRQWLLRRDDGGVLSPFEEAAPEDLAERVRRAPSDPQAAREVHGALHDGAVWLFLFEERRPSAWSRRHGPWFVDDHGWGRIDRWGPPEPVSAASSD